MCVCNNVIQYDYENESCLSLYRLLHITVSVQLCVDIELLERYSVTVHSARYRTELSEDTAVVSAVTAALRISHDQLS